MSRKVAVIWHAVEIVGGGVLYFFFVLPRWPELSGDIPDTGGYLVLVTALRILTGVLLGLAALPVVFTWLRTRRPEFGTPHLALRLRLWSIVLHALSGALIVGTAISEIWFSIDDFGRWLFGIYGAAAAICLLGAFAFYLAFIAELPPPPPKPKKQKKEKKEKERKRRRRRKKEEEPGDEAADEAEPQEQEEEEEAVPVAAKGAGTEKASGSDEEATVKKPRMTVTSKKPVTATDAEEAEATATETTEVKTSEAGTAEAAETTGAETDEAAETTGAETDEAAETERAETDEAAETETTEIKQPAAEDEAAAAEETAASQPARRGVRNRRPQGKTRTSRRRRRSGGVAVED